MKTKKQNPDFLYIGEKLVKWYQTNARNLPFRNTKNPYKIWICEVIFQQTRIEQGLDHYLKFIARFPNVEMLANADLDEVLLYWKGLGYYSRAINLHKAAQQIMTDFAGEFPTKYEDILSLKGVGKYTTAAIVSICFDKKIPAVDGNFYRVLSRVFADDYDISASKSFDYFSTLALELMPEKNSGLFNQAMMDLGSEICRKSKPRCVECPLQDDCLAFSLGKISEFPMKSKKAKTSDLHLTYYFVHCDGEFLIQQRGDDFIWKKLYEFPTEIPENLESKIVHSIEIQHKLTHKNLKIIVQTVELSKTDFQQLASENNLEISDWQKSQLKSFPKPLENYLSKVFSSK